MANKSLHDDRGRNTMRANSSANGKSVCVDVGRVLDSCSDRDCFERLRVYFSECDQKRVDAATCVRSKGAKVVSAYIDVDPLSFREGCYTCKITFYVEIQLELLGGDTACGCDIVCGCAVVEKKVILYGGEGHVQVFCDELKTDSCEHREMNGSNMPKCCVQVAEPVVLDVSLVEACGCECCGVMFPDSVCSRFAGGLTHTGGFKTVMVSIGLFTIVQMIRNAQVLIPVYDYCLPCKECGCDEETPCDVFKKMNFPVEEFFPPMGK